MPTSGSNWKTGLPVKLYDGKPGQNKCTCDCGQVFVGNKLDAICPACEAKASDPAMMVQPVNPEFNCPPISYNDPAPPPPQPCPKCGARGHLGACPNCTSFAGVDEEVDDHHAAIETNRQAPPNGLELDLINKVARLTQELDQVRSALGIPAGVSTLDGVTRLKERMATARRRAKGGPTYY